MGPALRRDDAFDTRWRAERQSVLARLGVWRSLLGMAAAAGDLQPFIAEATK